MVEPASATFITGLAKVLSKEILGAVGRPLAKSFQEEPRRAALHRALQQGLAAAFKRLPIEEELRDHYQDLFAAFLSRETAIDEFSKLIDPRPGDQIEMEVLRQDFLSAGFDPATAPFSEIMHAFIGTFYDAAAKTPELQGAIEIEQLREIAQNTGALADVGRESARHLEQLVELTERSLEKQDESLEKQDERWSQLLAAVATQRAEEMVLIPLSLWLQQNKPSGTSSRAELMEQLTAIYLLVDAGEKDPDRAEPSSVMPPNGGPKVSSETCGSFRVCSWSAAITRSVFGT